MYKDYPPNDSREVSYMDNFLFNVLASLTASVVVYLISKLFKAKSHSRAKSDLQVEFKFIFKFKNKLCLL